MKKLFLLLIQIKYSLIGLICLLTIYQTFTDSLLAKTPCGELAVDYMTLIHEATMSPDRLSEYREKLANIFARADQLAASPDLKPSEIALLRQIKESQIDYYQHPSTPNILGPKWLMEFFILSFESLKIQSFAMVQLKVDHLSQIRDSLGEQKTEQMISDLIEKLRPHIPTDGYFIRYTAEDFYLLLPNTSTEKATRISKLVQDRTRQFSRTQKDTLSADSEGEGTVAEITMSISIAEREIIRKEKAAICKASVMSMVKQTIRALATAIVSNSGSINMATNTSSRPLRTVDTKRCQICVKCQFAPRIPQFHIDFITNGVYMGKSSYATIEEMANDIEPIEQSIQFTHSRLDHQELYRRLQNWLLISNTEIGYNDGYLKGLDPQKNIETVESFVDNILQPEMDHIGNVVRNLRSVEAIPQMIRNREFGDDIEMYTDIFDNWKYNQTAVALVEEVVKRVNNGDFTVSSAQN